RNGLRTVILPKRNKFDLEDVPDEIKKSMEFVFVETVDDVLNNALEPATDLAAGEKGSIKKEKKKPPKKGKVNGRVKSHAGRG
ncbi:MAG TPA: S16 family serine protease, partial [Anaerolineales bacterium]